MEIFSNFRSLKDDHFLIYLNNRYRNKPITFWYDKFPDNPNQLEINPYNFLFLHEPNEFFGLHDHARKNNFQFTGILTWGESVLQNCDNAVNFTYNGRTLDLNFVDSMSEVNKNFNTTFLCGTKDLVEGHKLRHKVYSLKDQLKTPNDWYYTLEDYDLTTDTRPGYDEYTKDLSHIPKGEDLVGYGKRILYKDSMFNVAIENVKQKNWYNKIGDNFLSKTIPIYWGCPNIGEFGYDDRGIINFNNEEELLNIVNNLTPELYYQMKPYIDYNYQIAKLDGFYTKISEFFDEFFQSNSI
tara:strand:- start:7368 stop:8258 length:891 start_codon:yes stop_codon:yes gene_type:complete